jgi:hypothetical protein
MLTATIYRCDDANKGFVIVTNYDTERELLRCSFEIATLLGKRCLVVSGLDISRSCDGATGQQIGDCLDLELAQFAQQLSIPSVIYVLPIPIVGYPNIYERKVPLPFNWEIKQTAQATRWLN